MAYSFYGDLLDISGMFKFSPNLTQASLDEFCSTIFDEIDSDWIARSGTQILKFSNNFFMWGDDEIGALRELGHIFRKLLHHRLVLKGAFVDGKPNATPNDFHDYLPNHSILTRAEALDSYHMGARLIIENKLAMRLLEQLPDWQVAGGYEKNPRPESPWVEYDSPLRRIAPTPEGDCFEYLYFWAPNLAFNFHETDYDTLRQELEKVHEMHEDDTAIHYMDTISLLDRCQSRHDFTDKCFQ